MRMLSCVVVLLFSAIAFGQCPNGLCPNVRPNVRPDVYEWKRYADGDRTFLMLMNNGVHVGSYSVKAKRYLMLFNHEFYASACPVTPPDCQCEDGCNGLCNTCKCVAPAPLTGADFSRVAHNRYTFRGEEVTQQQAGDLVDNKIPSDANKFRLTFIGTAADCSKAMALVAGVPTDNLVIKCYPSDHPQIKGYGWVTTGTPSVYLQAPSGKVIHTQKDTVRLADAIAIGLRAPNPNYDDTKAPDLRVLPDVPEPVSPCPTEGVPLFVWIGLGLFLLCLLRSSK